MTDQAALIGLEIASVQRQVQQLSELLSDLSREQLAWRAGGQAESRIVRVLVGMDETGWHVLPDRRWPGTRRSNIDVILVGPGGVFVIDVKIGAARFELKLVGSGVEMPMRTTPWTSRNPDSPGVAVNMEI